MASSSSNNARSGSSRSHSYKRTHSSSLHNSDNISTTTTAEEEDGYTKKTTTTTLEKEDSNDDEDPKPVVLTLGSLLSFLLQVLYRMILLMFFIWPDEIKNKKGAIVKSSGQEDGDGDEKRRAPGEFASNGGASEGGDNDQESETEDKLPIVASPGLATFLDVALYRTYEAELVPTVCAASQLLTELLEMKETAALIWRECRWMAGVPFGGVEVAHGGSGSVGSLASGMAVGSGGVILSNNSRGDALFGSWVDGPTTGRRSSVTNADRRRSSSGFIADVDLINMDGPAARESFGAARRGSADISSSEPSKHVTNATVEESRWNEYEIIQDFAHQCYVGATEAIQRLTTDRLADSANLTLSDSILGNAAAAGGASNPIADGNDLEGTRDSVLSASSSASALSGTAFSGYMPASTSTPIQSPNRTPMTSSNPPLRLTSLQRPHSHIAQTPPIVPTTSADAGIGRCYDPHPRRDCWESPRLYCPDYAWADDAIGACQRLLRSLSKHRFVTLVGLHGWNRYANLSSSVLSSSSASECKKNGKNTVTTKTIPPPTYSDSSPHSFPSLETIHALQYLVSNLLPVAIPSRLNQFRAAVEANTVVSKRLYLVKCEYRAPLRAHMESLMALKMAPKLDLVERYLRDFHGVSIPVNEENEGTDTDINERPTNNTLKDTTVTTATTHIQNTSTPEVVSVTETKKNTLTLKQKRESLEKLISDRYWKHPSFVEALQLERCCELLEVEMSQMLLPLANVAREIMDKRKGRMRAVAVVKHHQGGGKEEEDLTLVEILGWREIPYMKELLRRLKSILCRKPGSDESTGIRPLLLDLQGVPRYHHGPLESSLEISYFPPPLPKPSILEILTSRGREYRRLRNQQNLRNTSSASSDDKWYHLDQFISQVETLLLLLRQPGIPFLVEERMASKSDKSTLQELLHVVDDVWDSDMFRAQFQDWQDMVKRQRELSAGGDNVTSTSKNNNSGGSESKREDGYNSQGGTNVIDNESHPSLAELSETIREAEIELSIAMASKEQLEMVRQRLDALRVDKTSRFSIMAKIVNEVGLREMNEYFVVLPSPTDMPIEFPRLSALGIFGKQLLLAGEVLPVG